MVLQRQCSSPQVWAPKSARGSHRQGSACGPACAILLVMFAADAFRPEQWHDFFVLVGGAAAALTGLVFVALSLNLAVVMSDSTHRYRSIGTLTNFAEIFVVCGLAVMGDQNH